jgi:hypothetical protein
MMYFRKSPDPMGEYVDTAGNRFSIAAARRIRTTAGVNVGYAPFESLAAALQAWGLTVLEGEVLP